MPRLSRRRFCDCYANEIEMGDRLPKETATNIYFWDLPEQEKNAYRVCNDRLK